MGVRRDYSGEIGKKYGRWTVIEILDVSPTKFMCRCDCGREYATFRRSLVTGGSSGCKWCHNKIAKISHNMTGTKLHRAWGDMKSRCVNPKNDFFKNYGGRGISVCEEWQTFEPFRDWSFANGYSEELSIDRINNNGNYEPSNCRWATAREQSLNKRSTRFVTINGEKITLHELAEKSGIPKHRLEYRYDAGIRDDHILAPPAIGTRVVDRRIEIDPSSIH